MTEENESQEQIQTNPSEENLEERPEGQPIEERRSGQERRKGDRRQPMEQPGL